MHCFLINAPLGKETWRVDRGVEIVAFHRKQSEVRMLFMLQVENLIATPNTLRLMHRGNVQCYAASTWPLPHHPDEPSHQPSILAELYSGCYEHRGDRFYRTRKLTPWDSWIDVEEPVHLWAAFNTSSADCFDSSKAMVPDTRIISDWQFLPFTSWMIGPFLEPGRWLFSLLMRFRGATYEQLLRDETEFSFDGPERALARIKYDDVTNLPLREQQDWLHRVESFEYNRLDYHEGYDVILLGAPVADDLRVLDVSEIAVAPLQLASKIGGTPQRFTARSSGFTMTMNCVKPQF